MYIERPDLQHAAENIWKVEAAHTAVVTAAAALDESTGKDALLAALGTQATAISDLHAHADKAFKEAGGEYKCHDTEGADDVEDDEDVIITPDSTGSGGKGTTPPDPGAGG